MDGGGADSRPPARSRIVYAARRLRAEGREGEGEGGGDANFSSCHESYRRSVNDFTLVPVTRRFPDCAFLRLPTPAEAKPPLTSPSLPLPSAGGFGRRARSSENPFPCLGETALAGRSPSRSGIPLPAGRSAPLTDRKKPRRGQRE